MADPFPVLRFRGQDGRPITSAGVKCNRAWDHLKALDDRLAAFRKENADAFSVELDPATGKKVYRRSGVRDLKAEPALIFGDLLQNLRSALDHIVYALAAKHTGADPAGTTEFPIFLYPFETREGGIRRDGFDPRGKARIKLLPTQAQEFIETQQPYHGSPPAWHDLWLLQSLVNIDKHRTIPLVVSMAESPVVEVAIAGTAGTSQQGPDSGPAIEWHGPAMREGDPILSLPPPDETYQHFEPQISVDVVVLVPGMKPVRVIEAARQLHQRIRWTVGELETFL